MQIVMVGMELIYQFPVTSASSDINVDYLGPPHPYTTWNCTGLSEIRHTQNRAWLYDASCIIACTKIMKHEEARSPPLSTLRSQETKPNRCGTTTVLTSRLALLNSPYNRIYNGREHCAEIDTDVTARPPYPWLLQPSSLLIMLGLPQFLVAIWTVGPT